MAAKISFETFTNPDHERDHSSMNDLALKLGRASLLVSLYGFKHDLEKDKKQHHVVGSHILSAISSISSIISLTEKLSLQVREAVLLSRGVYETLLVGAFCSVDDGASANRAILHSIYKTVRSQTQHTAFGSMQVKVSRTQRIDRKDPSVVEAMKLFGGSSNIRPCFPESRSEMISAIAVKDKSASLLFAGVEAMIYDLGSEIVHGSYYAFDAFKASPERQLETFQAHYQTAHYTVFLSTAAFCRSIRASMIPANFFEDLENFAIQILKVHAPETFDEDGRDDG